MSELENMTTQGVEQVANQTPTPETTSVPKEETPKQEAPKTFNLAAAEEEVKEAEATPVVEEEKKEEIKPDEVVEINVPAGEADKLIDNLPLDTYQKVVRSKVVKINEVTLKDIPTATTRVTSIADYKQLAKRRPRTKTAELTERVLVNSGFVITLKGATSLEMATIFTSPTSSDVDWEKAYRFCYEHTVGTSIGKLGYNEFVKKVDPADIETILYGIYEISESDSRSVTINCGECGGSYEVDVKIAQLPNLDDVNEETRNRIKTIVDAKNSVDDTRRIVEDSPTCNVKVVQFGDDRYITLRTTTGNMMIERIDRVDDISNEYGALIAILILYVESITIMVQDRPDVEPTPYLLDTIDTICEELVQLSDEELKYMKDIVVEFKQFKPVTYSIKGPCQCPNCGDSKKSIPCAIADLVFQKAQSVLA